MKFNDFIGNEKTIEKLGALIESNRFPHALVIDGERGIGKKTLARLLAQTLVCRGDDKPCNACAQCKKARDGVHPDIFEHIPSGKANSFHVDTVRKIIEDAYIKPNEAKYKIYILANAHCMNASAQNALLKILEEPPEYVIFILTAESKSALLSTVLSRSVVISLEGVNGDDGAKYLVNHDSSTDFLTAKRTIEAFNGNIGKAMESLGDGKANEIIAVCKKMCNALVGDNEFALLSECAFFQRDREAIVFACDLLKNIFRDALLADGDDGFISGQKDTAMLLRARLSRQRLLNLLNECTQLKSEALMNSNNSLLITRLCCRLRQAAGK